MITSTCLNLERNDIVSKYVLNLSRTFCQPISLSITHACSYQGSLKNLHFLRRRGGGEGHFPLKKYKCFKKKTDKKCLKCSETQEYAKVFSYLPFSRYKKKPTEKTGCLLKLRLGAEAKGLSGHVRWECKLCSKAL